MKSKILIAFILLLVLVCAFLVSADETSIRISNTAEFMEFAQNCNLDSYSQGLTVSLTTDIDLSEHDFSGIPIFCGNFQGNGYCISGLKLQQDGSNIGLFRYLSESATVSDLKVSGTIQPGGSKCNIGGLAGSNAGTIDGCEFSGLTTGNENIGGLVGVNQATGIIQSCTVNGTVYGNHFVGGIVGVNNGIIDQCENKASVNTEVKQNDVSISDITIDSLTGTESPAVITDIGGIAGVNIGSIRSCTNYGNVGYLHIGYNIGGITGNQSGYLADCVNHGTISGRKEIGGIAGQLEPTLAIIYSTDTIQILQEQVNTLFSLTNQTIGHLQDTTSGIRNQIILIQGELENAQDTLNSLIPETEDTTPAETEPLPTQPETLPEETEPDADIPEITLPQLPDRDAITEAAESLQTSITNILSSLETIYSYAENADSVLTQDLQAISDAVGQMQATLNNGSENLGGSVSDISDADTAEITTAKITNCQNSGAINADRNGGGIVGAIAFENDLDPEEDIEFFGESTLNFSGAYRASVTYCNNVGTVTVKKQYGGGIVGYATMGLIHSCTNHADLNCPDATYIGGIAGISDGFIRNCSAKNRISAKNTAGGIAGFGSTVSDCRSMAQIKGSERIGTILGSCDSLDTVTGNYYMVISENTAAIDGISYDLIAKPLHCADFLALDDLSDFFKTCSFTFVLSDGSQQVINGNTGEKPDASVIPVLAEIDGCKGTWQNLPEVFYFDTIITAVYDNRSTVVQSEAVRDDGRPVILVEGSFTNDFKPELKTIDITMAENAVEGWCINPIGITAIHYLPPTNWNAEDLSVMICSDDGIWKSVSFRVEGSYLVFSLPDDCSRFCVVPISKLPIGLWIACGASVVLILAIAVIIISFHKHRKRKASVITEESTDEQNCSL